MDKLKDNLYDIIDENKSDITEEEFFNSLETIRVIGDNYTDYDDYVVDTFLKENGFSWEERRYIDKVCKRFLGKDMLSEGSYEKGPYGGAFADEEDYLRYKGDDILIDEYN